jgi:shikimate kinase
MNLILIGFMGSGKTTIGKALAQRLGLGYLDTDDMIEKQQGMEIKEIFSRYGESYFRRLEQEAVASLPALEGYVVSLGGGTLMGHNNLETVKKAGQTIFLNAPLPKILNNLKGKFRPLVGNAIEEDSLRQLLEKRLPVYHKADIIIDTASLDVEQTIEEILKRIGYTKEKQ